MNKSKKIYWVLFFVIGLVAGISLATVNRMFYANNLYAGFGSNKEKRGVDDENLFKYDRMFREAFYILKKEFYSADEVTARNLYYGALKGMLEGLEDPYTQFMDPTLTKEFTIDMAGSFGGLGIQISERDGWLTVVSPIEDTPAWYAGLKPNDKIIEIETNSTKGMSVNEAVTRLRGKPGTKVTITIVRSGITEPFKVTLTRAEIKLKSVKSDIISNQGRSFAYIRILEFSQSTANDLKKTLELPAVQKSDGYIIDLRNNPGGLLDIVADCVNFFQSEGLIVYTKGRMPQNNSEFRARSGLAFVPSDKPITILINGGSASASEIFAGAMQDTGRGVLVGTKSYGKGSVQKTYPFADDGSLIKFTVAKYFTPAGQVIDKVGLKPDVEIKMWYEDLPEEEKTAMVKLQLTNLLKPFVDANPRPAAAAVENFRKELEGKGFRLTTRSLEWLLRMKKSETELPKTFDLDNDNQLSRAVDVMQNFKNYKKDLKNFFEAK